jgi:hypothetical protein
MAKIHHLVSTILVNYEEVSNSTLFARQLCDLQAIIEQVEFASEVTLASEPEGNLPKSILAVCRAFSTVEMSETLTNSLKVVFMKAQESQGKLYKIELEIHLVCEFLVSRNDDVDVERSSRWFREVGSLAERKVLLQKGFGKYQKEKENEKAPQDRFISSVLAANYLKAILRDIPGGLIPEYLQRMLVDLIKERKCIYFTDSSI